MAIDQLMLNCVAVSGSLAVLFGAFGAHYLTNTLKLDAKALQTWETANRYHFYSTFGLALAVMLKADTSSKLFIAGSALFSGSLYALVLSKQRWLGAITPVGGLLLVGGWAALGLATRKDGFRTE